MKLRKTSISLSDKTTLYQQLAALLCAGLALDRCLAILIKSSSNPLLRTRLLLIKQSIINGKGLAESTRHANNIFTHFEQQLIHLGEQTGKLDLICTILAKHCEKQLKQRREISQALFYPVILLIVAIAMFVSLLIFVIPHFAEIYTQANRSLPLFTQIVFSISLTLRKYATLIVIGAGVALYWLTYRIKNQRHFAQQLCKLFAPLNRLYTSIALSRLLTQLSIALSAGIPLFDALSIASRHSDHISPAIKRLQSAIKSGTPLHQAMQRHRLFTPLVIHMTQIGEETGSLDSLLAKASQFIEAEIQQQISFLTQGLEPLIMILLGVLIGGLVIAMYLPIFNLGTTF